MTWQTRSGLVRHERSSTRPVSAIEAVRWRRRMRSADAGERPHGTHAFAERGPGILELFNLVVKVAAQELQEVATALPRALAAVVGQLQFAERVRRSRSSR